MVLIYSTILYHLYLLPGLLIINICDTMYFDPMNKYKNKNKKTDLLSYWKVQCYTTFIQFVNILFNAFEKSVYKKKK
jgi:hypothetical protein